MLVYERKYNPSLLDGAGGYEDVIRIEEPKAKQ